MPVVPVDTPVGRLGIAERGGHVVRVSWSVPPQGEPTALLAEAARQMAAYFAGELRDFDLPLDPGGNDLERQVYEAMGDDRIPGRLRPETLLRLLGLGHHPLHWR